MVSLAPVAGEWTELLSTGGPDSAGFELTVVLVLTIPFLCALASTGVGRVQSLPSSSLPRMVPPLWLSKVLGDS